MRFSVLDPKGEDIKDPDSGEVLGSLKRQKVMVEVTDVQRSLSVARTFKKERINVGGSGPPSVGDLAMFSDFSALLLPPRWTTKYETLRANERAWEEFDETKSFVKTGDPVVQVLDQGEIGDDQPTAEAPG
jgi:hypothetical protein